MGVRRDGGCWWVNGMVQAAVAKSLNRRGTCAMDAVVLQYYRYRSMVYICRSRGGRGGRGVVECRRFLPRKIA